MKLKGQLSEAGDALVRAAMDEVAETDATRYARLESYVRRHVHYCEEAGADITRRSVFSVKAIERSEARAIADGIAVSPFISSVLIVADAVRPGLRRQAIPYRAPAPYSAVEVERLEHLAIGFSERDRPAYRAALVLCRYAGLSCSAAKAVRAEDIVVLADNLVAIWVAGEARWAIVSGRSAGTLARLAASRLPHENIGDIFSTAVALRVRRVLNRAVGAPTFSADRLRATWICERLRADIPVGALAVIVGCKPSRYGRYLHLALPDGSGRAVPLPDLEEATRWAQRAVATSPPVDPALFAQLRARRSGGERRSVPDLRDPGAAPRDPAARAAWHAGLRDEVLSVLEAATTHREKVQLAQALRTELTWAVTRPDVPWRLEVLVQEETIERWRHHAENGHRDIATVCSRLRRLAALSGVRSPGVALPRECWPHDPYTARELDILEQAPEQLPTRLSALLRAMLSCGLAVGPRADEQRRLERAHLAREGSTVVAELGCSRKRLVPASAGRAEALWRLHDGQGRYVSGLDTVSDYSYVARLGAALGINVAARRFRATWLDEHLERGVPFRVLASMAGTTLTELDQVELPTPSEHELLAWAAVAP